MKFKIGDRVIVPIFNKIGIVKSDMTELFREASSISECAYEIDFMDKNGNRIYHTTVCFANEMKLDIQYYRGEKLEEILK